MVPAKLLVGSVVAVGSVSTAAVVAHQQGFFSLPGSQTRSSDSAPNADVPTTPQAEPNPVANEKPNQKAVEDWLNGNKKAEEDWKIQIKKNNQPQDFKNELITEDDLNGLKNYLSANERESLLKDLFSKLDQNTLTFEKTGNNWKHILTEEDIKKWVDKTSENKAILKFSESNEAKDLNGVQEEDLNKLLKNLFDGKSAFTGITTDQSNPTKNILFEKDSANDWKHSKTEIANWLSTDSQKNLTIQIKKGESNGTDLDKTNEEDLIGLFTYLKTTTKETLLKFTKDSAPLTLKKDTNNWDVVHSETTINNWVSNTAGTNTTLKRHKDGQETTTTTEGEWKTLFDAIKNETTLFNNSTETRTIIFEQIDSSWKHIKTAIKEWLASNDGGKNKLTVQIKKDDSNTPKWDDPSFKDENWIGLLKHLKDNKETYVPKPTQGQDEASVAAVTITLQKDTSKNSWTKVTNSDK